jgi:fructose-1,6-bisphosphatase/inositol monophosphatase family enzyme
VWRTRGFGDFWSHMLVAEGGADIAAEPEVSLWDLAALQVVVEEAGGGSPTWPATDVRRRQRRVVQRTAARRRAAAAGPRPSTRESW